MEGLRGTSRGAGKFLRGAFEAVRSMVDRPALPDFPRYAIEGRLGEGGAAIVYRALDRELNRPVALKVLKEWVADYPAGLARFRREAQAAARLSHPNVVTVHDVGEHAGRPYLVMELVEGRTLQQILHEGAMDLQARLALLEKAARGVAAAHAKGLVHRDVKPGNILVGAGGEPKVADFGLALGVDPDVVLTVENSTLGTPLYMAPEQVKGGAHEVGPEADVYSLGAILYEMLAGRLPHTGRTVFEICAKILAEEPAPPPGPAPLRTICLKALDRDPGGRYADAAAFADDLARHLAGEPILAHPPGPLARAVRWLRRRPAVVAVAGAAIVVAVVLAWPRQGDMVARALVQQKLDRARQEIEQARREGGDTSTVAPLVDAAEGGFREGRLADAATRLDHALALLAIERQIRAMRMLAESWRREGRDASALLGAVARAEKFLREGRATEAMTVLEQAGGVPGRLQHKMQAVQEGVERWQRAGRDPSRVARVMGEFDPLMRQGRHAEAEAVLDRALELLRE